jgi:hypothetical protein
MLEDLLGDSALVDLMASDGVRMDSLLELVAAVRLRLGFEPPANSNSGCAFEQK